MAQILFGEDSPSGKLSVTFYDGIDTLPEFEDYSMRGRTYRYIEEKPQYPFGYGLTYGKVKVVRGAFSDDQVTAVVKNDGDMDTQDVIQVYIKNVTSPFAALHPRLCGFQRVFVRAGEEVEVKISLDQYAFTVIDEEGKRIQDGSQYELYVGCSQPDERSVELTGVRPVQLEVVL